MSGWPGVNPHKLIANRLATYPEVTALVPASKQHPGIAPQNETVPFIVWHQISGERDRTMDGPSGLARPRCQIDIDTTSPPTGYGEGDRIAIAVRHALNGYENLALEGERSGYDADTQRWSISHDYMGLLPED